MNTIERDFDFKDTQTASLVKEGDRLTTTSAEFDFCSFSGKFETTTHAESFSVRELKKERIIPNDPSKSRNGGDYYFNTYLVVK